MGGVFLGHSRRGNKHHSACRTTLAGHAEVGFVFGVVTDVDALHEEDHVFGDVGGVVADALQVAGHEDQVDGGWNDGGIPLHDGQELGVNGVAQVVYLVVGEEHAASHFGIAVDEGVQAFQQHGLHQRGHLVD